MDVIAFQADVIQFNIIPDLEQRMENLWTTDISKGLERKFML